MIKGDGVNLIGRNWLYTIRLNWTKLLDNLKHEHVYKTRSDKEGSTRQRLNELLSKYAGLFDNELGKINDVKAKLHVKPEVSPIFCKARTVPFAIKDTVENEIDRLEKEGIF